MSEIATLDKLELHLSHSAASAPRATATSQGSALEAFFSEIRYSSFGQESTQKGQTRPSQVKVKNGTSLGYRLRLY